MRGETVSRSIRVGRSERENQPQQRKETYQGGAVPTDRPTDRLRLLYQTTWRPPSSQTIVFYVKNTVDNQHQTPDTRLEYLSMFCSYRLTDQSSFKTNPVSFGRTRICGRPTSRRVSFFLFDSSWQTSFYFSLFFFCSFRVFWPSRFSTRSTLQPAYPFVPVCRRLSDDTRYAHTPPVLSYSSLEIFFSFQIFPRPFIFFPLRGRIRPFVFSI